MEVPWKDHTPKHCSFDAGTCIWLTSTEFRLKICVPPLITGFSVESVNCLFFRLHNWCCFIISLSGPGHMPEGTEFGEKEPTSI